MQNLYRAADFVVTTDDRVELAVACALGEVHRVFFERLALAFRFLIVHAFAAAHRENRRLQRLLVGTVLLEQPTGIAFVVQQCEQK